MLKPTLTPTPQPIVAELKTHMESLDLPRSLGVEALGPRVA